MAIDDEELMPIDDAGPHPESVMTGDRLGRNQTKTNNNPHANATIVIIGSASRSPPGI